jgi:hypothetical protein
MQSQYYRTAAENTINGSNRLSEEDRRMLQEGSAIDHDVIAERGVRTVTEERGQLPKVYSWRQKRRAPGTLFTVHRPSGETCTLFRPHKPDPKNPGHKYEQECKKLGGSGNVLDIHPSLHHRIDDVSVPVIYTEGIKKADSITSAARREGIDVLVVAISGVWNFLSDGEPIADMFDVPVEGRTAIICYDSDLTRNPDVEAAANRLAGHLAPRGADVEIVYLDDQPDGSKTGADDFLAGGRTLGELLEHARPYSPEDMRRQKLSKNERLHRALDYLTRREGEMPARTRRDCSALAAFRACRILAERRGKLVGDGVEVRVPALEGAEIAAMSQPTFSARMRELEESGNVRRIDPKRREHATTYVLLIPGGVFLYNNGRGSATGERETNDEEGSHRGYKEIPPLPEMRWSSPGRKARRGVVRGTRRVRQGRSLADDTSSIRRLGKKRGEIIRYLVGNGGSATRDELMARFGGAKTTWRDFKQQTLADLLGRRRQYQGKPLVVGPAIIELTDDGIRLVEDWREALEQHRLLGAEEEAAIRQKVDHLRQRAAYHKRGETEVDHAPTEEEMATGREDRLKRRRVENLVREGMARRFAMQSVYGADGLVADLEPEPQPEPSPQRPRLVDGVYQHGPLCACEWCEDPGPVPRYVTLGRSA